MPRISFYLPLMIVAIALPGAAAYLYYRYTQDPTLRPLGATQEELAKIEGTTMAFDVGVHIDWGKDSRFRSTPAELERLIGRTLWALDVDHHFRHKTVAGHNVRVTYVIGQNRFGPFPPDRAADGIRAAMAALRLTRRANAKR